MKTARRLIVVNWVRTAVVLMAVVVCPTAWAEGEHTNWQSDAAGKYLDERGTAWFGFDGRGEGTTRSTCISCHTVLPYVLARPVLRKLADTAAPTQQETRLLAQTRLRVEHWKDLDSKAFGLFYDNSEQKKKESWGTEAVFNALILGFDDRNQDRSSPSEATKKAFANLWETQAQGGDNQGSWDWLDFGEPPWGSREARYFGAALAAIAVGTAPGYYTPGTDADTEVRVELLRGYLKDRFPKEDLHNQVYALWAATTVDGILAKAERRRLIDHLLDKQRDNGGWSLPSLGTWVRSDGTTQDTASDGYATGLVLHVLLTAGVPKSDTKVAQGLAWLSGNQATTGAWRCVSVLKKRDPDSHTGKFMSDAATAFAVLALGH